jgi:hypothetical protein
MSLVDEINSIYDFVQAKYPNVKVVRQDVPEKPSANTIVIRSQHNDSQTETRLSYVNSRDFQIIYFGTSSLDVTDKADEISRLFLNDQMVIPIRGSLRYIRVKAFSFGNALKSASDIYYVIGILQTETREARDLPTYEQINSVGVTMNTPATASEWAALDGSDRPSVADAAFTWNDIESGKTIFDKDDPNAPDTDGFTWNDIESGSTIFNKE